MFTADASDNGQVEQMLTASQEGRKLPVSWQHFPANNQHMFRVDSINRGERISQVRLSWKGSVIGAGEDREMNEEIAAIGDFRWIELRNVAASEPYFLLRFTDPLKHDQNLDGLIHIGKISTVRYSIQDNELLIYPPAELEGNPMLTIDPSIRKLHATGSWAERSCRRSPPKGTIQCALCRHRRHHALFKQYAAPVRSRQLKAVDVKVSRIFENNILQFLQTNEMGTAYDLSRAGRVVLKKTIPLNGVAGL